MVMEREGRLRNDTEMTSNRDDDIDDGNVKLISYDRKRWLEKRIMLKMTINDDDDMFTTRVTSNLMCIM